MVQSTAGNLVEPGARFEQVASDAFQRSFCIPKAVLIDRFVVRFKPLSHRTAVRHSVDGIFSVSTGSTSWSCTNI